MTTTSYLFYSPQLDGMQGAGPNNVPPIPPSASGHSQGRLQSSPHLSPAQNMPPNNNHHVSNSAPLNDLNLTPQFGPFLGGGAEYRENMQSFPEVDVSFLNSPGGQFEGDFLPYMPVYTSPAYNPMGPGPAYSPMFGVPASPMFFAHGGQEPDQHNFDPLPDTNWSKEMFHHGGPPSGGHNPYGGHHESSRGGGRTAQFSQMQMGGNSASYPHGAHGGYLPPEFHNQSGKSVILDDLSRPHSVGHTLQDIVSEGLVADLATDQNGSRFIQTKLEESTEAEKQAVFEQILPQTLRLCTDVFGNYCIQKFFEYGTPEQKLALSQKIKHRVLPLSLQMYGCRVVQKILESVDVETQKLLIGELDGHVLECVKDQNANHVIQKCIEQVHHSGNIDFIIKAFYGRVYDLSTHPYGCRVIQRMLEHCYPALKELTEPVLEELMAYAEQLAKDQYGNYVLQHVLQHSNVAAQDKIVDTVAANILTFSKHKFASNVVERCFVLTDTRQKDVLLEAVVGKSEHSPLVSMVRDQYGNYVIQKMLETLTVAQRNTLIRKIQEYVPNIRKIAFGKHIVAKIEKLTGKVI